jgi:PIN domain nuclease of toxin-antitoxin system
MRHLLDTQALIWYVDQAHLLSPTARAAIDDPGNDLLLSAATIWEMGIKVSLNKLTLTLPYRQWIEAAISDLALIILPITVFHVDTQIALPSHHRDPFDRLLAAQSIVEAVPLISVDAIFDSYGVQRIWN